jgi:diguanylate cyclase (GGDEF)-like protein
MSTFASQIDLTTMLFVNAFTSCTSAFLFLCFWWATDYLKKPASLLLWSLANALMTIGFVALMLTAFNITVPRIMLIANLTIDGGMAVALIATNLFLDRSHKDNCPLGLAVMLAIVEIAYALSQPKPDFTTMLLLGCALRGLITIATGAALWRHADLSHKAPARLAAVLHFAWAGVMALRAMAALTGADSMWAFEMSTVVGLLTRLLLTWMIVICLLWMIARKLDERLLYHATRDALTGLFNRRVMWEAGTKRIESLAREGGDLALILLDIDNFKHLNDRWGHLAGDVVLVAVATRIAETVRSTDLAARVGGEEFMILLAPGPNAIVGEIAERIRVSIETMSVLLDNGTELNCTASLGHSRITRQDATWEKLVAQADLALYAAKDCGRNRVVDHTRLGSSPAGQTVVIAAATGELQSTG